MWWNPAESGWGVEFVQQRDVIFAGLYVQGPDSRPVWYTAALHFQGLDPRTRQVNFAGDLYETTGSWFGSSAFAVAANRRVGTMAVAAPTLTAATLTYSIDGVAVSKEIRRFTFRWETFEPTYAGTHSVTASRCDNPANDVTRTLPTTWAFTLTGGVMTVSATDAAKTCTYTGPYTQDGRLGRVQATYTCTNGEAGAMALEEINVQRFGLMGRLFGLDNRGCHLEGTFSGIVP